ncbi:MAG TPA: META domain-containing protein [Acidimicrobiia bacterium]
MTSPVMSLVGSYWKLLEVDGHPAVAMDELREAHIILLAEEQRLVGSSGCNRIMGTYEVTGDQLRISPLAMTMMMCSEDLMRQEQALTAALEAATGYRISGRSLELFDGEQIVARFEGSDPESS